MVISLEYVHKAVFPNGVVMERIEDEFLIRCGDYVWDWGLYAWGDRWTYDCDRPEGERERVCGWFHGRYLVPANVIERDLDAEGYPGGPVCMAAGGLTPLEKPSWFRETVRR